MSNGIVLYRGPSVLDGAPIVVIATGLKSSSANEKTGALIQTWILREDVSPTEAIQTGADASICGDCPHRGELVDGKNKGRSCYVTVFQAPLNVWKTYHRGGYEVLPRAMVFGSLAGKRVRLGSYGDPAAVPFHVWQDALAGTEACTGYTHQWRTCPPEFSRWCMASCDSETDRILAKAKGYRTFRVRGAGEPVMQREVICPASEEAGYKTTCAACVACGGTAAKAKADIAIAAHGSAAVVNNFNARIAA
jgi:hypothetical protein